MIQYLKPPINPEYKSYWATHFCSIFECLHYHKNLEESPRKLEQFPNWSMSDLRGNLPQNFFYHLKRWIYNWGFQYFMVNYLNQKTGSYIVESLLEALSKEFQANFSQYLNKYWFYISGLDSQLSSQLNSRFDQIFPEKSGLLSPDINNIIKYSDICLVLSNEKDNINVGIFGEIEGNKGNKLSSNSFWDNKSDYCVYGIGIIKGKGGCYIDTYYHRGSPKINIFFEAENFVVNDFYRIINVFEQLLNNGPKTDFFYITDYELLFFINHLKKNWNKPLIEIVDFFYKFLDFNEYIGELDNSLPFISSIDAKKS